jgi:hypothetical protein
MSPVIMSQTLTHLPFENSSQILCGYINATSQIQIVRIANISDWYFERVVFPGQRLMFEALPQAQLEIHTGKLASAILLDKIPCVRLRIKE